MASLAEMFNSSDANGDGRLDRAEYGVFHQKLIEDSKANGTFTEPRADAEERTWQVYNCLNTAEEGFTHGEWLAVAGKFMQFYAEIQAAEESAAQ